MEITLPCRLQHLLFLTAEIQMAKEEKKKTKTSASAQRAYYELQVEEEVASPHVAEILHSMSSMITVFNSTSPAPFYPLEIHGILSVRPSSPLESPSNLYKCE